MNTLASFGNLLGGGDLLIILVIMLLLFGAKKLPELAKGMGQAVKEFNKAKDEFEREISRPSVAPTEMVVQQPRETLPQRPIEGSVPVAQAGAPAESPARL